MATANTLHVSLFSLHPSLQFLLEAGERLLPGIQTEYRNTFKSDWWLNLFFISLGLSIWVFSTIFPVTDSISLTIFITLSSVLSVISQIMTISRYFSLSYITKSCRWLFFFTLILYWHHKQQQFYCAHIRFCEYQYNIASAQRFKEVLLA